MYDSDESHYYELLHDEWDQAQQEVIRWGEIFTRLSQDEAFQLAKSLLAERYLFRVPTVPNSESGMYEAFGQMKFRQGIQFVFDFIEHIAEGKDRHLFDESDR